MVWKKRIFGDRPIFKRKPRESSKKEAIDKKNVELKGKTNTDDKLDRKEKTIRIVLSKRDYEGILEFKRMRENEKKKSSILPSMGVDSD